MKILEYDQIKPNMEDYSIFHNIINNLSKKIKEKYGDVSPSELIKYQKVFCLLQGDFKKTILDLGCGSTGDSWDYHRCFKERYYEPWLCRMLHELKIKVVGIDCGKLDEEEFEHHSLDLHKSNSLSFIPDNSIDIAHARLLFDSPELERRLDRNGKTLNKLLMPQLERIMKPDGFFIYF